MVVGTDRGARVSTEEQARSHAEALATGIGITYDVVHSGGDRFMSEQQPRRL
jgi:hypothetical protein